MILFDETKEAPRERTAPTHHQSTEENMAQKKAKYVLVTTEFRGVFAGELVEQKDRMVTLKNARNCIYWSSDVGGFLGLAQKGPSKGCTIGTVAPKVDLFEVTSISDCTDEARKAWETA